ncbi:MAG: nucleotide sugar dehydrogenase, partial [Thermoplasmata archaeon]|nr:nucleotide sugar dehydrogenase [Thermoplasmata archaeon]
MSKICIIGLGYIGLPTAAIFASNGNEIIGVDINENARNNLMSGNPYPEEPGLQELLENARNNGKMTASESPKEADVFIICVPTPFTPDKKADLSYVADATKNLIPVLKKGDLVILESTVPPTTTREVVCGAIENAGFSIGRDVLVAFCPERVMPGKIVKELIENDRVIGGMDKAASQAAREVYESFSRGKLYLTDATTAEFVKLIENSFRDINIAFANELAIVSKDIGIDIWEAIGLANRHPRVNIHNPGPGVGGHCIAVDPYFIIEQARGKAKLMTQARENNSKMPAYVVEQAMTLLGELAGKKIAV